MCPFCSVHVPSQRIAVPTFTSLVPLAQGALPADPGSPERECPVSGSSVGPGECAVMPVPVRTQPARRDSGGAGGPAGAPCTAEDTGHLTGAARLPLGCWRGGSAWDFPHGVQAPCGVRGSHGAGDEPGSLPQRQSEEGDSGPEESPEGRGRDPCWIPQLKMSCDFGGQGPEGGL